MLIVMTVAAPPPRPLATPRADAAASGQRRLLCAVVLTIVTADQVAKAWAWRQLPVVHINSGSGLLFGDRAGEIYRDDALGAAVEAIAVGLFLVVAALLVLSRRPM